MAGDCPTPIDVCSTQFNRLDCDGTVLSGPTDKAITCRGVDVKVTPKLVDSKRDVARNGGRGICAQREIAASVDGYDVVVTACPGYDAELFELLGLYDLVLDTADITGGTIGDSVGIRDGSKNQPCACITSPCQNPGVSMLMWSNNTNPDGISVTKPYNILALARVKFDPPAVTIKDAYENVVLNGKTTPNPLWVRGPGDIYPDIVGLDGAWAEWDTIQVPPSGCACDACGYAQAS